MSIFRNFITQMRKITAIVLAFLLVLSTSGITISKHFCMGELIKVSFYEEVDTCFDYMGMSKENRMNCCEEVVEEYKADELSKTSVNIKLKNSHQLLATIAYLIIDNGLISNNLVQVKLNYKPPLIEQDIPILTQSFLI